MFFCLCVYEVMALTGPIKITANTTSSFNFLLLFSLILSYVKMWYGNFYRSTYWISSDNPRWNAQYYMGKVRNHPLVFWHWWLELLFIFVPLGFNKQIMCTLYLQWTDRKERERTQITFTPVTQKFSCRHVSTIIAVTPLTYYYVVKKVWYIWMKKTISINSKRFCEIRCTGK